MYGVSGPDVNYVLAGCPCLLRGGNGPEVVTRMAESARRHVTVEQVHVAHKTGVEERRLICGRFAAADQRAPARSTVFLELIAKRLEGLPRQRGDGAAKAVQNIALKSWRISRVTCSGRVAAAKVAIRSIAS
jgi:hypothetical protein